MSFGGFLGFLVTIDGSGEVEPALDFSVADLGRLPEVSGVLGLPAIRSILMLIPFARFRNHRI